MIYLGRIIFIHIDCRIVFRTPLYKKVVGADNSDLELGLGLNLDQEEEYDGRDNEGASD